MEASLQEYPSKAGEMASYLNLGNGAQTMPSSWELTAAVIN